MFRCENCGECPAPRTPCHRVVVQKKKHLHPERPRAKKGTTILKNGKKKMVWLADFGGWGDQIVKEMNMCPRCAAGWGHVRK